MKNYANIKFRALAAAVAFTGSCLLSTQAMAKYQTCDLPTTLAPGKTASCTSPGYIFVSNGANYAYAFSSNVYNSKNSQLTTMPVSIKVMDLNNGIVSQYTGDNLLYNGNILLIKTLTLPKGSLGKYLKVSLSLTNNTSGKINGEGYVLADARLSNCTMPSLNYCY